MDYFNFYNPDIHKGNFPVRVLQNDILERFELVNSNILEMAKYEIKYGGLNAGIAYEISESEIQEVPRIDPKHQIHIQENYLQFVWAISYSTSVIFKEGIHKPSKDSNIRRTLDLTNNHIITAIQLFDQAMKLLKVFKPSVFFTLPNPERYNESHRELIGQTNAVFVNGFVFTLLHEFGHQYYEHVGVHTTSEESKNQEIDADNFALQHILLEGNGNEVYTKKAGVVLGLGSLSLLSDSLWGGNEHPDPDARLKNVLEQMNLVKDDKVWGIASLICWLWVKHYNKKIDFKLHFDTYKDLFDETYSELQLIKY